MNRRVTLDPGRASAVFNGFPVTRVGQDVRHRAPDQLIAQHPQHARQRTVRSFDAPTTNECDALAGRVEYRLLVAQRNVEFAFALLQSSDVAADSGHRLDFSCIVQHR